MDTATVSKVKRGTFIKRTANAKKTYIRGEYIRDGGWVDGKGRYSCMDTENICKEVFLKGNAIVFFDKTAQIDTSYAMSSDTNFPY